jgi:hypothetical protein
MNPRQRQRLDKLSQSQSPPSCTQSDSQAYERLRAAIAAEFGVSAVSVWRSADCPALCLIDRVCDGLATAADMAQFNRIVAETYFADRAVSTAAFLLSVSQVRREY